MNILNLSIPTLIASVALSIFAPSVPSQGGHWEYDEYYQTTFYVYETREEAVFDGESEGVGYFRTEDGNVWGCYLSDTDLEEGDTVTLTFENRVTQEEYARGEETGETRIDSGRIIEID